jgi:hypothetical protein
MDRVGWNHQEKLPDSVSFGTGHGVSVLLERPHVRNSRYPDQLEALLPNLASEAPLDPMSGQPCHYRPCQTRRLRTYPCTQLFIEFPLTHHGLWPQ